MYDFVFKQIRENLGGKLKIILTGSGIHLYNNQFFLMNHFNKYFFIIF
jgi:long-subunit acyl-CoA synthetase (AMP-forming)